MMIAKKQYFSLNTFEFQNGRVLPVHIGYETFGKLNEDKSNAVLVAHYFSANSHCAGKYHEDDAAPGFWDGLIGSGKAVDTDRYFVICCDNLCNCGAKNPMVETTGPMSINPETGKEYGLTFPVPEVMDLVNLQKAVLESLGIRHLHAVMGPSLGAMTTFQWIVAYPDWMDLAIPVIGTPRHPVAGSLNPLQHGIRVAKLDPKWNGGAYYDKEEQPEESLRLAVQMMTSCAFHPGFLERTYYKNRADDTDCYAHVLGKSVFEKAMDAVIEQSAAFVDLNHWIYTCRMCMNFDVARPYQGDLKEALKRIKAKVLAIPCKQDMLHPWEFVAKTVESINELGGCAELYPIESDFGHMAGILETSLFAEKVREFMNY